MPNYFAYGSNMSAQRMRVRLGWSPFRYGVILKDYVMIFNKHSNDGGKANIQYSPGHKVEGIIYHVYEDDLLKLDHFEGVADSHYKRQQIKVHNGNASDISAITYIALKTGAVSAPTEEYLNHILEGKEFLSPAYFANLAATETI